MGGNRGSLSKTIFNTLFVFALSGFWHGANWTFIIWGLLNGLYLVPNLLLRTKADKTTSSRITVSAIFKMLLTFTLVTFTWIFFRSANVSQAFQYISGLFSKSLFQYPVQHGMAITIPLITALFGVEWLRKYDFKIAQPQMAPAYIRWTVYVILIIACFSFFKQDQTFIYFQF